MPAKSPLSLRQSRLVSGHTLVLVALLLGASTRPVAAQQELSLAAPVLTLDEAITLALAGNYGVANATLGVEKSGASVDAIKTLRLPILKPGGDLNYSILKQPFTVPAGAFGDYPIIGPIPATDTTLGSIDGFFASAAVGVSQPLLQLNKIGLMVDVGHGLAGVEDEMQQDLHELGAIRHHERRHGARIDHQVDGPADEPPQRRHLLGDDGVEVDDLRLEHLEPGEGEELVGQVRRLGGRGQDLLGGLVRGRARPSLVQQLRAVAADRREQVVEVVRDATGEPPGRLELLGLAQLLLEP